MAKPGALMKSSDKMNHDLGELITVDSIVSFSFSKSLNLCVSLLWTHNKYDQEVN